MFDKNLSEEALKEQVRKNFFDDFTYEPNLKRVDFALLAKDDTLKMLYLLWAEAKAGDKEDIYDSFVQLILTIGVEKLHKFYSVPEFLGAFDAQKFAFISYKYIRDFVNRSDFNWKNITPSDHNSKDFARMRELVLDILKDNSTTFCYDDSKELKDFIKNSIAKGVSNPIKIDDENFNDVYSRWEIYVLPQIKLDEKWKKIRNSNKNILLESDFFLADLMSKDNVSIDESLRILLKKRLENSKEELFYEVKISEGLLSQYYEEKITFKDQSKHKQFWNAYERPPEDKFWDEIWLRRDKIVPRDIMERKGAYFTPQIWVKKAQEYLSAALGKNWQDEYYIWDCAAGTGNLLVGLTRPERVFASTLDLSDVLIMKKLTQSDKNLKPSVLEGHIFQFDFLNDEFFDDKDKNSKLPLNLQEILRDPKKREKLIIFINPPYAEATSPAAKGAYKAQVARGNKISEIYKNELGKANNELFAQFFIRIYKEIPNCVLASFSTLKYTNSTNFAKFREIFKAKFLKGFICPANSFDNVKGKFPIGFLIWNLKENLNLKQIRVDVFNENGAFWGEKNFYSNLGENINRWIKKFDDKNAECLAFMGNPSPDFQAASQMYISLKKGIEHFNFFEFNARNLIVGCIYLAVRQAIEATWLNDRDQFLQPNSLWEKDDEFQNDCLAFALFHKQNRISSKFGDNHFIPFSEKEVSAKEAFKSDFMVKFINGKCEVQNGENAATPSLRGDLSPKRFKRSGFCVSENELRVREHEVKSTSLNSAKNANKLFSNADLQIKSFVPTKPLKFSTEAKAVFAAGREIWQHYHKNCEREKYNANASLYDIRVYFQGTNNKGDLIAINRIKDSSDKFTLYKNLYYKLDHALDILATKITPKIYEYEFLKE